MSSPPRRALGRGLEALLPSTATKPRPETPKTGAASAQPSGSPLEIPLDQIERNPYQTRSAFNPEKLAELAQSIASTGVVQPVVVRPLPDGRFQLIMGERRVLASRQAGKQTIPAIVRAASDEQTMEMTIVENLQRADLNPMEQARAYQRLADEFKLTQEQMAQRTGKERASVANFMRLLRLPGTVQTQVEAGELSFGHARTLLSLPDAKSIEAAARKVVSLAFSVRQTESYVQGVLQPGDKPAKMEKHPAPADPNVQDAQDRLQRSLGLRVRIEDRKGKGRVVIEYASLEDFDALLTALNAQTLQ